VAFVNRCPSTVIVQTPRLVLREFEPGDGEAMHRVFGDREVMRYSDGVRSPQWVRAWIEGWIDERYRQWGFGVWAVLEKPTLAVIGYCGLSRFPERRAADDAEIGFRLMRPHWGRGLATEAAVAVRAHAFDVLRLPQLVALIDPQNLAAVRVARKIGLRYEGEVILPGYDHPDHLYALGPASGS
jgi:[ribosomal protein S5]-alanine N-acetyltransferase